MRLVCVCCTQRLYEMSEGQFDLLNSLLSRNTSLLQLHIDIPQTQRIHTACRWGRVEVRVSAKWAFTRAAAITAASLSQLLTEGDNLSPSTTQLHAEEGYFTRVNEQVWTRPSEEKICGSKRHRDQITEQLIIWHSVSKNVIVSTCFWWCSWLVCVFIPEDHTDLKRSHQSSSWRRERIPLYRLQPLVSSLPKHFLSVDSGDHAPAPTSPSVSLQNNTVYQFKQEIVSIHIQMNGGEKGFADYCILFIYILHSIFLGIRFCTY